MVNTLVYDKIGQEIKVGSIVAAPYTKTLLNICKIQSILPKTVKLEGINCKLNYRNTVYKKHHEVVCLDEMEATVMFLLKQNL
jgi:hypothetical protein